MGIYTLPLALLSQGLFHCFLYHMCAFCGNLCEKMCSNYEKMDTKTFKLPEYAPTCNEWDTFFAKILHLLPTPFFYFIT